MKILQVNASYKPAYIYGGPTMSVSKLSEQLVKASCELEVLTTTANGTVELEVPTDTPVFLEGVKVTYLKRLTKDHSHFSPSLLKRVWKLAKHYDVVHIHAWWNLVSMLSCLIAVLRGAKVVVSPRGTLSAYSFGHKNALLKKILHRLVSRPLLSRCFVHATSMNELAALRPIVKPKHFFNIPNFVQLSEKPAAGERDKGDPFKLLFLSRIDEKKGLDILLNALPHLTIPYQLTIVGDGEAVYLDHLKNIAKQNDTEQHINWLGFRHGNKFELFAQHDLFVLPSRNENFGNVVIESLSTGTAVAISTHVGLADYVAEKDMGWVFDLNTISLADSINNAARQTEKLNNTRTHAAQQIRDDFSEDKLTQRYVAMYDQILNHG